MTATDTLIVKAIDDLRADVQRLKDAAYVLDEYANGELKSGYIKGHPSGFEYLLGKEQVSGITYMLYQVREMADALEQAINDAFDPAPEPVKPVTEYLNGLVAQAVSEVQLKADIEELHDKAKALIASFGAAEKSKGETNE
ncbi:hypothetical protein AGR1A_Cc20121 [Agrobacterium fabacearum CFBP 5771]|uniref:hypothetical protein n=1 Tax=Agrobacterium tumefaciens TaxID=358 RepID=UPI0004712F8A|nr:hypothetical protein [Agrobacterium tumefaciens]CVI14858.1 hypothetical protein AGR1A_Cc20121 [Agrobacterium fabacearum CFBP 5771]